MTALTPAQLTSILQYHLLPGAKSAADLQSGGAMQSTGYTFPANGTNKTSLSLNTSSGVKLTDAALTVASVTAPNLNASNGIIHQVDKVLVPPGVLNVVQMAQVNPTTFSTLVSSVESANLNLNPAVGRGQRADEAGLQARRECPPDCLSGGCEQQRQRPEAADLRPCSASPMR